MPSSSANSPPDYYDRLGVGPSASTDEIRAAYRKKARDTHPDRNPDDPTAAERFQKVKEAYKVLGDPERRARYDDARAARRRVPSGLTINQQAPAGCGGYLWRVLAGTLAVGIFLVLEVMGVWAAPLWTIVVAIGLSSLVAGAVGVLLAQLFPDQAVDVQVRLTREEIAMWADGRVTFRLDWGTVSEVRLRDEGWTVELVVPLDALGSLQPVPPVLTDVAHRSDRGLLRLDLSNTDVPRRILLAYLREVDAIPFSDPAHPEAGPP